MALIQTNIVLKAAQLQTKVKRIRGWDVVERGKSITRTYSFPSFPASVRFVGYVAELAESMNHHPDIDIRYNKVTLTLSTHDAGGVTEKDLALVNLIDQR